MTLTINIFCAEEGKVATPFASVDVADIGELLRSVADQIEAEGKRSGTLLDAYQFPVGSFHFE